MSERLEREKKLIAELPFILDGLNIVVHSTGFTIHKREHKTSRNKKTDDLDLMTEEQLNKYPYLVEMLPGNSGFLCHYNRA